MYVMDSSSYDMTHTVFDFMMERFHSLDIYKFSDCDEQSADNNWNIFSDPY